MGNWRYLTILIISLQLVNGCFLNSCPYRRYGRSFRCSSCGPEQKGICVEGGQCCTRSSCFPSVSCGPGSTCPENYCRIMNVPGVCVRKLLCCTSDGCVKSMQCL